MSATEVALAARLRTELEEIGLVVTRAETLAAKATQRNDPGYLDGFYSVRLTYQDRIVYTIHDETRTVIVHRARSHDND